MTDYRKIVLFGSGVIAEKSLKKNPCFIVDNNPDLQGTLFHGIEIKAPNTIRGLSDKYRIIICTSSVSEVRSQLEAYGYEWGRDAQLSGYLAEKLEIANLESQRFDILISSGLPSTDIGGAAGGVYRITESREFDFPSITKLYGGNIHGMTSVGNGYAFASQGEGIVILNKDLQVTDIVELPPALRPHGVSQYQDGWVFVSSYSDGIIGIDASGRSIFEYYFSDKRRSHLSAQHHCNDICLVGDYAYVSMFSITGNWKKGIYDGGIVEINLKTGVMETVATGLTMPHNVSFYDGELKVLNSFKGEVMSTNLEVKFKLPGFVRGYDENSDYIFVGESKNRNFSRLETGRAPVSIDSRITIMHKALGFSRSIPLPSRVSEIHSLLIFSSV